MAAVLLTRPAETPSAFVDALAAAGHSITHAPVMRIISLATPLPGICNMDGLLFTSAAAVEALPDFMDGPLRQKPCLATGPATAKALAGRGFAHIEEFSGEMDALVAALKMRAEQGFAQWLYPCGTVLSHQPEDLMARSGAHITPFPVYSAEDCGLWADAIINTLATQTFDWTMFLSVRTAELFVRNIKEAGLWVDGPPGAAACISERVAAAIAPIGFRDVRVGEEKTTSSLVAATGLTYC